MLVASFDISMTATGCVLVNIPATSTDKFHLLQAHVAVTEKNSTSEKVSNTLDSVRRADSVHRAVKDFLHDQEVDLVVVEAMSWPRNASSAIKMAMVWGTLAPMLVRYPLIEVGPQEIKIATAKSRSATKEQVEAGVKANALLDPQMAIEVLDSSVSKRALKEHCWDAMGAVYAAMQTQKYGLIRAGLVAR